MCTVTTCTAAASESRRRLRSTDESSPASSTRCRSHSSAAVRPSWPAIAPRAAPRRRGAGRSAAARRRAGRAGATAAARRGRSSRTAPRRRAPRTGCTQYRSRSRRAGRRRRSRARRRPSPTNGETASRRSRPDAVRLLQRFEQHDPVLRSGGTEHARRRALHGRHPGREQRFVHEIELRAGPHDHRDVARTHRPLRRSVARTQQHAGCRACVTISRTTSRVTMSRASPTGSGSLRTIADPHRRAVVSSDRPGCAADTGATTMRGSPSAAPRNSASSPRSSVRVAAPVLRERRAVIGRLAGREVGVHVRAAEGVDGLLRIADQDERRVAVEREPQDVPLHRVGVLELVDEHDPVAAAQPRRGGRAGLRIGERAAAAGSADRRSRGSGASRLRRSTSRAHDRARTAAGCRARLRRCPGTSTAWPSWTTVRASAQRVLEAELRRTSASARPHLRR